MVEARAPIFFGDAPDGFDEAARLEAIECLVQRAVDQLEIAVRPLLQPVGDRIAVERAKRERLEDEHLEVAAQNREGKRSWLRHRRRALYTGTV